VVTSLIPGNFLKIDLYSSHTPEVQPSSTALELPSLHSLPGIVLVSPRWVVESPWGIDRYSFKKRFIYKQ